MPFSDGAGLVALVAILFCIGSALLFLVRSLRATALDKALYHVGGATMGVAAFGIILWTMKEGWLG